MTGIEVMARTGEASHLEVKHAAGNAMVQIAVGCVCAFALGCAPPVKTSGPPPTVGGSKTTGKENDQDLKDFALGFETPSDPEI